MTHVSRLTRPGSRPRRRPEHNSTVAALGVITLSLLAVIAAVPANAKTTPSASGSTSGTPIPGSSATPKPKVDRKLATFGIDSASATKPDTRFGLNFDLQPGSSTTDHVAVVNNSARTLTLDLYTADGRNAADGKIEYLSRRQPGQDARTWVTLALPHSASSLRLPARSTRIVPISVKVPTNATPGDHLVGIVVSLPGKAKTSNGKLLNFDQGVGLPTAFHVSGDLSPTLAVEKLTASYDGTNNPVGTGTTTVSFTVHNVGNVTLGAAQKVDVGGLFGSTSPTHALADVPALLPGNSISETVRVTGTFPTIRMNAHVHLTPKQQQGQAATTLKPVSASTGLWAVPWVLLALILAVIVGIVAAVLWRRAHPRKESRHSSSRARRGSLAAGKA